MDRKRIAWMLAAKAALAGLIALLRLASGVGDGTAGIDRILCVPICALDPTGTACVTCMAICMGSPI